MSEQARKPAYAAGFIAMAILAALATWLFATMEKISITSAGGVLLFVIFAGWGAYALATLSGDEED